MAPRLIGYARTANTEGDIEKQISVLREAGCDEVVSDVAISGRTLERPGIHRLIDMLQQGDQVVSVDLSRLSRDPKHLKELVDVLHQKAATFAVLDRTA